MTSPDPLALQDLAIRAARAAGELLHDAISRPRDVSTKSSPTDVVTEMDRASEQLIAEILLGERPDDAMLGEEGGERPGTSGVRWVLDPLDGTVNYLYRIPAYSVCIAAEADGEVVAGVVFDPGRDELFTAALGAGATCNGTPIAPSNARELPLALIGTGFSYSAEERERQGRVVASLLPRVRDVRRFGSAALDLCAVACGRLDGYFERGLHPWDSAAATLIVREAGAVAEQLADDTWVAANATLYEPFRTLVAEAIEAETGGNSGRNPGPPTSS